MNNNSLEQAEYYDEQAFACNGSRKFKEALEYYQKSLKIKEEIHGSDHEEISVACRNIAVICENMLQYDMALSYYGKALEILEELDLEDSREGNKLLSYMGNLYGILGEHGKSLEFLEKALTQSIEELGDHLETAQIYSFLSSLYVNMQEFQLAYEMEQEARTIFEEVLGLEDERTQRSDQHLFFVLLNLNQWEDAQEIYQKTLDSTIECFGDKSIQVFDCMKNFADDCYNANQYTKALDIYHKIVELESDNVDKMLNIYNRMGQIYQKSQDSRQTYEYYMKAYERLGDIKTEQGATICNNIATYLCDHAHYNEAIACHKKVLEIRHNLYGEFHPATAQSYNNLAFVYSQMKDYATTHKLYAKTLEIRMDTLGELHDDTIVTLSNIAYTYNEMKEYRMALKFYEEIWGSHVEKYGETHRKSANSLFNVGITYYNLRDFSKAMHCYTQALELARKLKDTQLEQEILQYIGYIT
ncbi:MAG: tetratricopeptide repeat protein [Eubacteriales bacterium]